jgi:hypothetical protein
MQLKIIISLLIGLLSICSLCKSQSFDSSLALRSQGQLNGIAGLGVCGGLRAGVRYHVSDRSSIELAYGFIPFIELAGEQAKIIGSAYNYYLNSSKVVTGFISILLAYNRIETTAGQFKNDLFILSPTVGFDIYSESRFGFFIRMGLVAGLGSASSGKIGFNFDIGTSLRIL